MARSTYIYVVVHPGVPSPVGAYTTKHECVYALSKSDTPPSVLNVLTFRFGEWHKTQNAEEFMK